MLKIEKIDWGKIKINGKEYSQVIFCGEKVWPREEEKLRAKWGTSHRLGEWEEKKLLRGKPEVILVATGWEGVLKVGEEWREKVKKQGVELKEVLTGEFLTNYGQLVMAGRKVNGLVHTTC